MDAKVREKPKDRLRFPLWIRAVARGGGGFLPISGSLVEAFGFYFEKGPGLFQTPIILQQQKMA